MKHVHTTNPSSDTSVQAAERLKQVGLKVTKPRLALLRVLMEKHGPFTQEELHREVKAERCDLVTVYRCLSAFQESGLVRRCDFGDGAARFEYQAEGHHHHHVICRECRKVTNLDYCIVEGIESLLKKEGFYDVTHSLEFFGTCADCHTKN